MVWFWLSIVTSFCGFFPRALLTMVGSCEFIRVCVCVFFFSFLVWIAAVLAVVTECFSSNLVQWESYLFVHKRVSYEKLYLSVLMKWNGQSSVFVLSATLVWISVVFSFCCFNLTFVSHLNCSWSYRTHKLICDQNVNDRNFCKFVLH